MKVALRMWHDQVRACALSPCALTPKSDFLRIAVEPLNVFSYPRQPRSLILQPEVSGAVCRGAERRLARYSGCLELW
jgi:hypothetical protein